MVNPHHRSHLLDSSYILKSDAKKTIATFGKSFNWGRRFLQEEVGNNAAILYRFCRILDDIADSYGADSRQLLKKIKDEINSKHHFSGEPVVAIARMLTDVIGIPKAPILDLLDGLIGDCDTVAFEEQKDVIQYSYRVAGTVGLMMTTVLRCDDAGAANHAIDLGIAMQMTNIARDVLEDAQMGRRYLPGQWCNGLSAVAIIEAARDSRLVNEREVICEGLRKLLALSEDYYHSGLTGLSYIPFRNRIGISVAAGIYREIGRKLIQKELNWWEGRTVVSLQKKMSISIKMFLESVKKKSSQMKHEEHLHIYLDEFR